MPSVRHYAMWVPLLMLAASCGSAPDPTPTRTLSGPTLAPTGEVIPAPPSEVPSSFVDSAGASDPTAAALPNDLGLPPLAITGAAGETQTVQISLSGQTVLADLYENVVVRSPGVMLLAENREVWGQFPRQLEQSGYVVLAVDLPPGSSATTVNEIMGSFSEVAFGADSRLDSARIAVMGEQSGADAALRGCAVDSRCDALVMLSPLSGEQASTLALAYGDRPLFVAASQDSPVSYTLAQSYANRQSGETLFQPFASAGSGAQMLTAQPTLATQLIGWLDQQLQP